MDRTEQLRREGAVADLLVAAIGLVFLCAAPALLIPQPEPTMSTTAKTYKPPQAYSDKPRPPIVLTQVESNKIAAVGHDPATNTLAVQFKSKTGKADFYHYPNVTAEQHAAFVGAESMGRHFGAHLQDQPFEKFPAETSDTTEAAEA